MIWLVPYKTGELSVTANTNDQEVRYTLETTKEPVTILLHPIEEKRDMDQQDIVQVELFLFCYSSSFYLFCSLIFYYVS